MNYFRPKVYADVDTKTMLACVSTWVMNKFRLKVQADIKSKIMLACVYIGDEQF